MRIAIIEDIAENTEILQSNLQRYEKETGRVFQVLCKQKKLI